MTTTVVVDACFPLSVNDHIDATGVRFIRLKGALSDLEAVRSTAAANSPAFVTIGRSSFLDDQLRQEARELGVMLIAAVEEDPFEAEQHLFGAAAGIAARVTDPDRHEFYWLKKHGLDLPRQEE